MNAAEKAIGLRSTTLIATVVNLVKTEFPDIRADLKPWSNDQETRTLVDPDSLDIGFHLPGWSRRFQSRSILMQIRFYEDPLTASLRAIGIEMAGFTHTGEQWRLSTIEHWQFWGQSQPVDEIKDQLKHICREIFKLVNGG